MCVNHKYQKKKGTGAKRKNCREIKVGGKRKSGGVLTPALKMYTCVTSGDNT